MDALVVWSATLVAVIVYTPAVAGDVYVTATPEALVLAEKLPPVAAQVTPWFVTSLLTVAVSRTACVMVRAARFGETATLRPTAKFTPLLAAPPTVTTKFPVEAPFGTGATMLVAVQLVGVAVVPLNFTVLVPCVVPKFVPEIVTEVPTEPDAGDRLVMFGGEGGLPAAPVPYIDAGQLCQVKAVAQVAGSALSPVLLPTLLQAVPSSRKWTTLPFTPSRASQ
jgi:hypothetical protein